MVGIMVESVLFSDPEQEKPTGFCPKCGLEIYDGGEVCTDCREDRE